MAFTGGRNGTDGIKTESQGQPAFSTQESYPPAAATHDTTPADGAKTDVLPFLGDDTGMDAESDEKSKKKTLPWMKKKSAVGPKISRKIRKRRQNAKLKNILAPKNALMVLNELYPELKIVSHNMPNQTNQTTFTVEIELMGEKYYGHGMSKMIAKHMASENALKTILMKKIVENSKPNGSNLGDGCQPMDTSADLPKPGEMDLDQSESKRQPPEDDVPWGSLASFAMYKLFSEWQAGSQSIPVPPMFMGIAPPLSDPEPKPPIIAPAKAFPVKKVPEDAHLRHPVQLLNTIVPGCQYVESREGVPPNLVFHFTVELNGSSFTGSGNNKKEAKKNCAKKALETMGVVYSD